MTREEAIISLESIRRFKEMCGGKDKNGIEALDLALTALRGPTREMVERMRGEWKPTESPYMNECEDCSVCGYRTVWGHGFRFCPSCGAPMTDEAVDMMLERWKEALLNVDAEN